VEAARKFIEVWVLPNRPQDSDPWAAHRRARRPPPQLIRVLSSNRSNGPCGFGETPATTIFPLPYIGKSPGCCGCGRPARRETQRMCHWKRTDRLGRRTPSLGMTRSSPRQGVVLPDVAITHVDDRVDGEEPGGSDGVFEILELSELFGGFGIGRQIKAGLAGE